AVALLGTALGEWSRWHLTAKGAGAVAYLVVFGSILGYSAYTYALRHASPTIVGTYAYVNPVIAVLLGWLILREPVSARTFLAMALILGAVVWIQFSHKIGRWDRRTGGLKRQARLPRPPVRPSARPPPEERRHEPGEPRREIPAVQRALEPEDRGRAQRLLRQARQGQRRVPVASPRARGRAVSRRERTALAQVSGPRRVGGRGRVRDRPAGGRAPAGGFGGGARPPARAQVHT